MQLSTQTDIPVSSLRIDVPAFGLIENELKQVRELVREQLSSCPDRNGIGRLVESLNSPAGKMIRAGLVLLSNRVASATLPSTLLRASGTSVGNALCEKVSQEDAGDRGDAAVRIGVIVEMIHNASLLHDDVIDEGKKRRGVPTVNSLWGNESAVLLGDFLLSRVLLMCGDLEPRYQRIIAAAAARTCEGELRQIIQRRNWQMSESEYIEIITEKTAALFSSCCHLGALSGGASWKEVRMLKDFGLNVGIAFQITDDLLDIIGDEKKVGKSLGSDICKSKPTLALIHLLGAADEKGKSLVKSRLGAGGGVKKALMEMLRSYGSLDYARRRAQEFVEKAIAALADLKDSDAKNALIETAKLMADRAV